MGDKVKLDEVLWTMLVLLKTISKKLDDADNVRKWSIKEVHDFIVEQKKINQQQEEININYDQSLLKIKENQLKEKYHNYAQRTLIIIAYMYGIIWLLIYLYKLI